MIFDRYEQLTENAQRLLCYYAKIGAGSERRMTEHFYTLRHHCFPTFEGEKAQKELVEAGIFIEQGRDWYSGVARIDINPNDFVPSLWYLHELRKDILLALQRCKAMASQTYLFVRYAIGQLVESGYQQCNCANAIGSEQAALFYCVVQEPQFRCVFGNFPPTTFVHFFMHVTDYLIEHDIVADTTTLTTLISRYSSITENTRSQLLSEVELYDYIATGAVPSNGIFANITSGAVMGALRHLCNGTYAEAVKWFEQALQIQSKSSSNKAFCSNPLLALYLIIAYMAVVNENKSENKEIIQLSRERLTKFPSKMEARTWHQMLPARILAEDFCNANKPLHKKQIEQLYQDSAKGLTPPIDRYLAYLLANYLGHPTSGMDTNLCQPKLALLQHEMSKYLPLSDDARQALRCSYGNKPALAGIYHKAAWESVLEDLMNEATGQATTEPEPDTRLMYIRESADSHTIQVREQSRLKNGTWGNGKRLSDTRYRKGDIPYMNHADRRILARLNHSQHWDLQLEDVVEEMIDENRLYFGKNAPFELVKVDRDKPYLIVENEDGQFVVKSNVPVGRAKDDMVVVENSPTHYSIINIPNEIRDYYVKLLQLGTLPLEAEETLRALLAKIGGKVELHSSLIEGGSTLPMTEGQWNVGFKLIPRNSGNWTIEVFVRPLRGGRRIYPLAEGNDMVIDENEEGRFRVKRNMRMEETNRLIVQAFWEHHGYEYDEENTYTPEFMLDLVQMIQEQPDTFYAEWPEGQGFKIKVLTRGAGSWSGTLKQRGQWFDIEGEVDIDENTRISISQLLELVGKSKGNFVRLSDGEFLALSEKLKHQLKALDAIANRERGNIRISPFSAALIGDDLLHGELELQMDEKLEDIRQKILDGSNYTPEVPKELNAILRPYQKNGYLWIARLNSWGAGALLADDMGLGKTIQTIAFLLLKKDEGPSLVVAPASVAPNWKTEMERFAPTLNVRILNFATNRRQAIDDAKAGDVIVTTYGILLSIQDIITQKHWNVACLDEAHIIKNRGAKTSAAAMKIQADNRVMLTGTPVQNHLGELWNLFQFVNPGLLGCYEHFSQKFIIPIEGYQDKDKQEQLERIVHPFMLRRTKQAVLKELPEKTEIYHTVELNRDELAIYESIRIRAEKMLQDSGMDIDMHVLAEITRLRQAACSAQLIEPKWTGDCSKITALVELLQGVIEGGNRALVFSQFVSFFDLVRKELDRLGMKYFYIDGSVPLKQRTDMVEAFQQGENSLFLISLKAGGLGLNLTGANYVFHLDPWWNPAIEQQATDRAYRIGQTQAVTVYHLISKNTIEEKIIRLHQTKRDLADNILAGTDTSYKLTGKDLLEMIAK